MTRAKTVLHISLISYFFSLGFPAQAMYSAGARAIFAHQHPSPFHDQFPGKQVAKIGLAKSRNTKSRAVCAHPVQAHAQEPQISYARLAGFLSGRNWGYFKKHNELVVQAALKQLEDTGNPVYSELCDMVAREEEYFCDAQEYVGLELDREKSAVKKCGQEKQAPPLFSPAERADVETDFVAVLLATISKLLVADIHKGFRRVAAQEKRVC
jgi:hypothetical protein